jgi:arsenate reductase
MRILILCTGNSCRSQMAEGFLKSIDLIEVHSAGTQPAERVHPMAVKVMSEVGIDLSSHKPESVDQFLTDSFDYVITVCDNSKEDCPVFMGDVKHRLHIGCEDPAEATGTEDEILEAFRIIRDQIKERMNEFYREYIKN